MADFTKHVASIFFPGDFLRELNSNLSEKGIWIIRNLSLCNIVEGHEFVFLCEFSKEKSAEQFFDIALFTASNTFHML